MFVAGCKDDNSRGIPGASIFVCGSYCGVRAGWLLAGDRFIVT
ncbi:hypothetical protein APHCRT_1350 [Anaplasma phagocytophilum str. CRT53-1]|uniref:Uncharacterized protein n=1 Tax=Anaplasma phagocytophilum str. CRT53-1 TaxID=1359157 RepID=A0A0F3PPE0_ANAPH|nr:hypothetical protein APHCRT_1350 [Anaplasma phagocytophilum str. CRT53-1]